VIVPDGEQPPPSVGQGYLKPAGFAGPGYHGPGYGYRFCQPVPNPYPQLGYLGVVCRGEGKVTDLSLWFLSNYKQNTVSNLAQI
jgi:hypothetical protein